MKRWSRANSPSLTYFPAVSSAIASHASNEVLRRFLPMWQPVRVSRFRAMRITCAGAAAATVAACGSTTATPTPTAIRGTASSPAAPTPTATPSATADACAVPAQSPPASGFAANFVTALAFAPDGRLFYTERAGSVMVWQNGAAKTFATVRTATDGERGLLGVAISPTFSSDRYVYAFYSDANGSQQHVIRWKDCAGTGTAASVLVTLPAGSDCCHKGGRLAFGKDGMLYVTLGEEHTSGAAQNTADPRGKVLRYTPAGGIPADNPFGPTDPVWAYGLRNPFGIAVSPPGRSR